MVPNRLRKCGHYIYCYVGGSIVRLSYMSFQNRHSAKTSHAVALLLLVDQKQSDNYCDSKLKPALPRV